MSENAGGLKVCNKCGFDRVLSDFPRHARRPDGRLETCRDCHNSRRRLRAAALRLDTDWLRRRKGLVPLSPGLRRAVGMPHGYFVDRHGRVFSMHKGRIKERKLQLDRYGYWTCSAKAPDGSGLPFWPYAVHRIVCMTFHGQPAQGQVVRHLDGCRTNNVPDNVMWGTPLENQEDRVRHGTYYSGEKIYNATLTDDQAAEVRRRSAAGERSRSLAEEFGVNPWVVYQVKAGRSYRSLKVAG